MTIKCDVDRVGKKECKLEKGNSLTPVLEGRNTKVELEEIMLDQIVTGVFGKLYHGYRIQMWTRSKAKVLCRLFKIGKLSQLNLF